MPNIQSYSWICHFHLIAIESSPTTYLTLFRSHCVPFIFISWHLGCPRGIYQLFVLSWLPEGLSCRLFRCLLLLLFLLFLARFLWCILLMLNVEGLLLFLIRRWLFDLCILLTRFLYFNRISLVMHHSFRLNLLGI